MTRNAKFAATLLLAVVALAAMAGAFGLLSDGGGLFGGASSAASDSASAGGMGGKAPPDSPAASVRDGRGGAGTHIVVFREAALGTYRGEIAGMPAPQRRTGSRGRGRIDMQGAAATNYVGYLRNRQAGHERAMERRIGRSLAVRNRMQRAVNGIVTDLSVAEVDQIRQLPEVLFVEEYREYAMDTDVGPTLIGAPAVWDGSNPGATVGYKGEGMVVGILDSGINFGSPSFAAVDPIDGYQHVNPLGAGQFLGTCATGGPDVGRCNAKLIGGYNFVCGAPGNQCGVAGVREEPGFGDTNGHGTHVASTVAGNHRDALYRGVTRRISGVAPRANIVAFDICYTNTTTGQGLCPNVSAVAALEQLMADGIVDVINYSIGGGAQPWSEAVSLGFLSAVESGVYVAASAGNSGPGPNTMGHLEPWVSSTAAAQHGRGDFSFALQVTGPQPVPEPLAPALVSLGSGGVNFTASIPNTTPIRVSARFDQADDACAALPGGTFAGAIAVVRRGTCSFTIKTNNAAAAGAIAVIIVNNAPGTINPSVPDTTIPAFGMQQAEGTVLRDFARANPSATGGIAYPPLAVPNIPDVLGSFSSRGPAGTFDLVKPDVTAPGVLILAAYAGDTITGFEQLVSAISGTSMASPHQAGAAVLVRQARSAWTVPEVKSALAMTADPTVWLEDQVTPANAFARGTGRIRVDRAINAGLVMDETAANYRAANPAIGGDVAALNQPSMARRSCFNSCSFTRTFRNPTGVPQGYSARIEGLNGTVSASSFAVAPGATMSLQVTVDTANLTGDGVWHFGTLVLQPNAQAGSSANAAPTLRLPIAVAVQPPAIRLPDLVQLTLGQNRLGTLNTSVTNAGGSILDWAVDNTGSAAAVLVNAPRGAVGSGYNSSFLTDNATTALFASDDFTVTSPTTLTSIYTEGFNAASVRLAAVASELTWSIYPDAGGRPAGNPATAANAAVWLYRAAPTSAGISITGTGQINNVALDLARAGQNVVLPPGRYWLVVNARTTTANRWLWFASNDGSGGLMTMSVGPAGATAWGAVTAFSGLNMRIDGLAQCGASWMGAATPSRGVLAPDASRAVRVAVNSRGLAAGTYNANLCVVSNDPLTPKVAAPVRLVVTP